MNAKGYASIPGALCYWITFLTKALPLRSIGTFIELLMGAMLTPNGFVTEAYMLLEMKNHWTSYYKWLQRGRWSWLGLGRQFVRLLLHVRGERVWHLVIDDTLTLRASKKAPSSAIHHQHGNKPNLASYVRGQCWVSLAAVLSRDNGDAVALPLLSRLIPGAGNTGKLMAANTLIRAVYRLFSGKQVRVLVDSWYMRRVFIQAMGKRGFHVIGQARKDTRLYDEPKQSKIKRRGRPRAYGEKVTAKRVAHFPKKEAALKVYGQTQTVRYRSRVVKARFLEGQTVLAVWCELKDKHDQWRPAALLLSTDVELTPEQVIESYGLRWSVEPMFHQLKNAWGLKQAWQQTRQTLNRWVQITQVGYGLLQLLTLEQADACRVLCDQTPWRKEKHVTAGRLRAGLVRHFRHVNVRRWWNKTCKKFEPPSALQVC